MADCLTNCGWDGTRFIHVPACSKAPKLGERACLSGCIGGTDHDAQRTYVAHAEECPHATYPCEKCGKPRSKAEGGTTFTVCDACWVLPTQHPLSEALTAEGLSKLATLLATETRWDESAVNAHADELARAYLGQAREIEALKAEREALKADFFQLEFLAGSLTEQNRILGEVYGEARAKVARLEQEKADYNATAERRLALIERYEGLISAITCDEADAKACERYCAHGYGPLHAEARAIKARQA